MCNYTCNIRAGVRVVALVYTECIFCDSYFTMQCAETCLWCLALPISLEHMICTIFYIGMGTLRTLHKSWRYIHLLFCVCVYWGAGGGVVGVVESVVLIAPLPPNSSMGSS